MFAKTTKFVRNHSHTLAFCAGSLTTTAIIIATTRDTTLLSLDTKSLQFLKDGGAVVYELKDQTLHLVNITAAEAAKNVA